MAKLEHRKKGNSIPNTPSAVPVTIITRAFLPPAEERDGERKQNAGTWNRERGTIYLRKERKKGGLKKDDDAWSRESNHVIIFERWEKIIFFSFPLSPLLFFILFPSITVCRMYKRNLKATEVVRDLAFPPGPAGVAFKINSIFKREKRCEEIVREDVRKRGEQTAKEREEYRAKKERRRVRQDGEDSPERESVSASMCSNKV